MGKQINFFMTAADEAAFLSKLQGELGPLLVIANGSKTERAVVANMVPADATNANVALVRADNWHDIISTFVHTQGVFCVDFLNSEVIQFHRCKQMSGWLAPGRLWYDDKTNQSTKSREFCLWAKKVLAVIEDNYRRTDDGLFFVGSEAKHLNDQGLIKLGPPKEGVSLAIIQKTLGLK